MVFKYSDYRIVIPRASHNYLFYMTIYNRVAVMSHRRETA
jgi:hypothetical protein